MMNSGSNIFNSNWNQSLFWSKLINIWQCHICNILILIIFIDQILPVCRNHIGLLPVAFSINLPSWSFVHLIFQMSWNATTLSASDSRLSNGWTTFSWRFECALPLVDVLSALRSVVTAFDMRLKRAASFSWMMPPLRKCFINTLRSVSSRWPLCPHRRKM